MVCTGLAFEAREPIESGAMEILHALLMGLVEGLTEFIPVSSTGHLILVGHLLGIEQTAGREVAQTFEVIVQLGAILAVVVAYPRRFAGLLDLRRREGFAGLRGLGLLLMTTLPAVIVGAIGHGFIKRTLFHPVTVAIGLIAGAVWIIFVEWRPSRIKKEGVDSLRGTDALAIGLFQCLALWPGLSRSAATILGAMMIGVQRKTAVEYSFFAAIPVLTAASALDLYKSLPFLTAQHVPMFVIGLSVSFLSAWVALKLLLRFLAQHTLVPFAWYRVAVGVFVLWHLG